MFDKDVINYFLENQTQLFDEEVASTPAEAQEFLEECMAQVVDNFDEVVEYFDEIGGDIDGMSVEEIEEQSEVFKLPDGRYLLVEG